jgi:hypothetical protein
VEYTKQPKQYWKNNEVRELTLSYFKSYWNAIVVKTMVLTKTKHGPVEKSRQPKEKNIYLIEWFWQEYQDHSKEKHSLFNKWCWQSWIFTSKRMKLDSHFILQIKINSRWSWATVAHTCNPSYLGGWDWEGHDSRTAWANSSQDPISKITRGK